MLYNYIMNNTPKLNMELVKPSAINKSVQTKGIEKTAIEVTQFLGTKPFPYKHLFGYHYLAIMKNLKTYYETMVDAPNLIRVYESERIPLMRMYKAVTPLIPLQYNGKNYIIPCSNSMYYTHNCLSEYYQEGVRLKAKRKKAYRYPIEYWSDFKLRKVWIKRLIKDRIPFTFTNIRDMMDKIIRHQCDHFSPTVLIDLLQFTDFYSPASNGVILDICAGWGDRMLTAIAIGAKKYIGVDPNTDLRPGYEKILSTLSEEMPDDAEYTVIYKPCETLDNESLSKVDSGSLISSKVDLVWACPPYFNAEEYSMDETQSTVKYEEIRDWLHNFLLPSLEFACKQLRKDGSMILTLNDIFNRRTYEPLNFTEFVNLWIGAYCVEMDYMGCVYFHSSDNSSV